MRLDGGGQAGRGHGMAVTVWAGPPRCGPTTCLCLPADAAAGTGWAGLCLEGQHGGRDTWTHLCCKDCGALGGVPAYGQPMGQWAAAAVGHRQPPHACHLLYATQGSAWPGWGGLGPGGGGSPSLSLGQPRGPDLGLS